NTFVPRPSASDGVKVRTPVVGFKFTAPDGVGLTLTRLKVNALAGMSESVAVLVTVRVASSLMFVFAGTVSTGGLFTSLTITVKLFVSVRFVVLTALGLYSVLPIVNTFVPHPS